MPAPPLESEPAMVTAIGVFMPRPAGVNARSTLARSSRAAFAGSGASDNAEITAMPSAPAAINLRRVAAIDPGNGADGHARARARE